MKSRRKRRKRCESMSCVVCSTRPVYRNAAAVSVVHVPQRRPRGLRAPRELPRAHRRHGRRFLRRPRRRVVLSVVRRGDDASATFFSASRRGSGASSTFSSVAESAGSARPSTARSSRRGSSTGGPGPARREYRGVAGRRRERRGKRRRDDGVRRRHGRLRLVDFPDVRLDRGRQIGSRSRHSLQPDSWRAPASATAAVVSRAWPETVSAVAATAARAASAASRSAAEAAAAAAAARVSASAANAFSFSFALAAAPRRRPRWRRRPPRARRCPSSQSRTRPARR